MNPKPELLQNQDKHQKDPEARLPHPIGRPVAEPPQVLSLQVSGIIYRGLRILVHSIVVLEYAMGFRVVGFRVVGSGVSGSGFKGRADTIRM